MKLKVSLAGLRDVELDRELTINNPQDIFRLGFDVARAVREWIRTRPLNPHPQHAGISLDAEWEYTKPAPKLEPTGEVLPEEKPKKRRKRKN